jgi:hypothetical protein
MGHGRVQTAWDVAAVLLKQLCAQLDTDPKQLEELYDQHGATVQPSLDALLEAMSKLLQSLTPTKKVFILLDAWDDSNMRNKSEFDKLFHLIISLPWKFFITSRTKPPSVITHRGDWIQFDMCDGSSIDLEIFIRDRLRRNISLSDLSLLDSDSSLMEIVVQIVLQKSDGMYVYLTSLN